MANFKISDSSFKYLSSVHTQKQKVCNGINLLPEKHQTPPLLQPPFGPDPTEASKYVDPVLDQPW